VQTESYVAKVPEGFVPYRQHRFYAPPLLHYFWFLYAFTYSSNISGENGLYLRDVILGLNDGLVSMFLLLLGVSGGGVKATEVPAMRCSFSA